MDNRNISGKDDRSDTFDSQWSCPSSAGKGVELNRIEISQR